MNEPRHTYKSVTAYACVTCICMWRDECREEWRASWHTDEWVMSRRWVNHVTQIKQHWHTSMSHGIHMCDTHTGLTSVVRHVTHTNESCHIHDWVMSHRWMCHITQFRQYGHIQMSHGVHTCAQNTRLRNTIIQDWRVTCGMGHIQMSHVTQINGSCHANNGSCHTDEWVMSNRLGSTDTYQWVMAYTRESTIWAWRVANESRPSSVWYDSGGIRTSHVTRMN